MATPRRSARGSRLSTAPSAREGAAIGTAQQQQRLGQVDRPGVHLAQTGDQGIDVAVGIVAGDLEQGLRDRERGPQLMRGVRGEPLLLGHVRLQLLEHRVEDVGEVAELVTRPLQRDPVRQGALRREPGGIADALQRRQHPSGEQPSDSEPEGEQDHHDHRGDRHESPDQVTAVRHEELGDGDLHVRHVSEQIRGHRGEQQSSRHDDDRRVAQRQLETGAHPAAAPTHRHPSRSDSRRRGR